MPRALITIALLLAACGPAAAVCVQCSGCTLTTEGRYSIATFTTSPGSSSTGAMTVYGGGEMTFLIVGGGGGGGGGGVGSGGNGISYLQAGGGGAAGGYIETSTYVTPGEYQVIVGSGGVAGAKGSGTYGGQGQDRGCIQVW